MNGSGLMSWCQSVCVAILCTVSDAPVDAAPAHSEE